MKLLKTKYLWVIATLVLAIGYVVSCTKDDQVITTPQVINNSTDLVSINVATAPTIDGTIDPMWANSPKLLLVHQYQKLLVIYSEVIQEILFQL